MNRYVGVSCPVCDKKFTESDAIVVCPDCGAPHHRSCYTELGHCALEEKHGLNEEWKQPDEAKKFDGLVDLRCSRCNTLNPSKNVFCEICGTPLHKPMESAVPQSAGQGPVRTGTTGGIKGDSQGRPPYVSPLDPYTTPYGGLHPDEEVNGVTAHDMALFVGNNSSYYLPRFKLFDKKKVAPSWNLSGFFFSFVYYFYRKMYAVAIPLFLFYLCYFVPSLYVSIQYTQQMMFGVEPTMLATSLGGYLQYMQYINYIIMLLSGTFANMLYRNHVFGRIGDIKGKNLPDEEYKVELRKKGGTNGLLIKIILGILIIGSFAAITIVNLPYYAAMLG